MVVLLQLALALADLALQMQSWTSVVTDLIGQFSGDMATIPALLDVLIVLPEEVMYASSLSLMHSLTLDLSLSFSLWCLSDQQ